MNTELMTTNQVKKKLQISERTLRRWIAAGLLPRPRLPGRWLKSEIDSAISGQIMPNHASEANTDLHDANELKG